MPTPTKGPRLGGGPSHERLMLANLATALFADIGPRYAERSGGYTRITKVGPRKGDNAPMAVIELVEAQTVAQEAVGEAERARGTRFRRPRKGAEAGPAATTAVDEGAEAAEGVEGVEGAEGAVTEEAANIAAADAESTEAVAEAVPAAGDTEGAPQDTGAAEQVAVPTEGGDTEVVTENADTASDQATDSGAKPEADTPAEEPPAGGADEADKA